MPNPPISDTDYFGMALDVAVNNGLSIYTVRDLLDMYRDAKAFYEAVMAEAR